MLLKNVETPTEKVLHMSISYHHGPIKIRDAAVVNVSTASPDYDFLKARVSRTRLMTISSGVAGSEPNCLKLVTLG
jgi:hypothetical protein